MLTLFYTVSHYFTLFSHGFTLTPDTVTHTEHHFNLFRYRALDTAASQIVEDMKPDSPIGKGMTTKDKKRSTSQREKRGERGEGRGEMGGEITRERKFDHTSIL